MSFTKNTHEALHVFLENMVAEGMLAKQVGLDVPISQVVSASFAQILKITEESLPLSRLMDGSDLVLHAEGPGAAHHLPWLSAFNWITDIAGKNLRELIATSLDLSGANGKKLSREADLRLSGFAPGSIWVGLKIVPPTANLLPDDPDFGDRLLDVASRLPEAARFIDDEGMRPGLDEAITDPAVRDVVLHTLLKFAPTGRKGIHTLDISTRKHGKASLSQRERVVLREAISHPDIRKPHSGSFTGEVRVTDLDKTRFHMRTMDGVLRCILPNMTADKAQTLIGRNVKVTGRYENDRAGRPRLMLVDTVEPAPMAPQLI